MITYALYGRMAPTATLPRLHELVRVRDFARRHDGQVVVDWIKHWRHLPAFALINNCEQGQCKSRLRAVRSLREGRTA